MRSDFVVVTAPGFDADLRVDPVAKPLQRQALIPELPVERFVGAILPWLAGVDERRLDLRRLDPAEDRRRDEFGAVVPSDERAEQDKCFSRMGLPRLKPEETASYDPSSFYHVADRAGSH